MKQPRIIPARRKKALRRLLLAAVLLAAVLLCSTHALTPLMSLRMQEELRLTGRTQVTRWITRLPFRVPGLRVATLSENENAVVFTLHRFHLLFGWYAASGAEADCSGAEIVREGGAVRVQTREKPVYAAFNTLFRSTERASDGGAVFLGRVADAQVDAVEFWADYSHFSELPDAAKLIPEGLEDVLLARQDGFAGSDAKSFCLMYAGPWPQAEDLQGTPLTAGLWCRAYDADSALLWSEAVTSGWATSME